MTSPNNLLTAGDHRRELTVDEVTRNYLVHIPDARPPADGWPVVLAFHGGGSNAADMVRFCGLNQKADSAGFVAVYPNGSGRVAQARTFNAGNCCGYAMRRNVDDVHFVSLLLEDLSRQLSVDQGRIFATGMSNGAVMSYRLASELSDRIAAIAPVAGPMGFEECSPKRPVPVCHFHGTSDEFARFEGGIGRRSLTKTNFLSVDHSIRTWVQANGCDEEAVRTELPMIRQDGTNVIRFVYSDGKHGSEVVLYRIENGGHTWPGRPSLLSVLGRTTRNVSANDVMWNFFQKHPMI